MKKIHVLSFFILVMSTLAAQAQNGMFTTSSGAVESTNGSGFICIGEPLIGSFQQQAFLGAGFDYMLVNLREETEGGTELILRSVPNPFDDVIQVTIDDIVRDKFLIRLINNNGRLIDECEQTSRFTYDLGYLSAGIYGLLIHDLETKKLLGKRKIMKR